MRIIGGTHRSRTILSPREDSRQPTRPITDRVKQALFDRLVAMEALGEAAVDVFAGTGSLGLEALSRGVDHVTFIENGRGAKELLEQNIQTLDFQDRATVLGSDALTPTWIALLPHQPLDLIFLDPPYQMLHEPRQSKRINSLIAALAQATQDQGVLVLRSDDRAQPPAVEGWSEPQTHPYGSMSLHYYIRLAPPQT